MQTHSRLQRLENLIMKQHARIFVIYNNLESQIGFLPYKHLSFITLIILRTFLRQIMLYLSRCHNTVTFLIQMYMHQISSPFLHLGLLFTERNKKVLHQSPIQKCTILVYPCYFQTGKFSYLNIGLQRSSYQALIHIKINEHVQHIARFTSLRHITLGKQYFAIFITIKVHAEINFLNNFQLIISS